MTSCPYCGSAQIIRNARVIDAGRAGMDLHVTVYRDPDALLFKGAVSHALSARVCGRCGYTALFAEGPADLMDAAAEAPEHHLPAAPPPPLTPRAEPPEIAPDACLRCGTAMAGVSRCPSCGWTYAP